MTLQADGYTFALSDGVTRTPVRYTNRYGIEIAADLYQRKGLDESVTYPAIVIGPPHGGVKEQGPGVYAQELAKRGFVTLSIGSPGGDARKPDTAGVVLQPLEDVGGDALRAIEDEAARLTDWLGGTRVLPRFPSPLFRAA